MIDFKKHIHYDEKLEQAIIGICLLENTAIGRTHGLIEAETFYFALHQQVYSALREMFDSGLPMA